MPKLDVEFTEFVLPRGHRVPKAIAIDDPDGTLAAAVPSILERGVRFETETLTNGMVSVTITHPEHGDLFHELSFRSDDVPQKVATMIRKAAAAIEDDLWPEPPDE